MVVMLAMVNEGNGAIVAMVASAPRSTSSQTSYTSERLGHTEFGKAVVCIPIQHRHCHGWKWVTTNAHANNML